MAIDRSIFSEFQKDVSPGTRVRIYLANLKELVGHVQSITAAGIKLNTVDGTIMLAGTLVAGWEVLHPDLAETTNSGSQPKATRPATAVPSSIDPSSSPGQPESQSSVTAVSPIPSSQDELAIPSPPAAHGGPLAVSVGALIAEPPVSGSTVAAASPDLPSPADEAGSARSEDPGLSIVLAEISGRYEAAGRHAVLTAPPPRFAVAMDGLHYNQQKYLHERLDQARQRYEGAIRSNDLGRLASVAYGLADHADNFPNTPGLRLLAGQLFLLSGKAKESLEQCEREWRNYGLAAAALCGAVAAGREGDHFRVCFNLVCYVVARQQISDEPVWYRLIYLLAEQRAYDHFTMLLEPSRNGLDDISQTKAFREGLAYCLRRTGDSNIPVRLFQKLLVGKITEEVLSEAHLLLARHATQRPECQSTEPDTIRSSQSTDRLAPHGQENVAFPAQMAPSSIPGPLRLIKPRSINQASVPQGNTPYARAKRAQLRELDLDLAETLFRQAISDNDNRESAIKDLAALLEQRGRREEAIQVLEGNLKLLMEPRRAQQMLVNMYQQVGRNREAISYLDRLILHAIRSEKPTLLKRKAFSYYHLKEYDQARRLLEQVLALSPRDQHAMNLMSSLTAAQQSSDFSQADELFQQGNLTDLSFSLGPFLEFALEHCDFEGVKDAALASRSFTKETLSSVEALIESKQSRGRPRERARYLLTAARLMQELQSEDHARFRQTLAEYASAMGESSAAQHKPMDVVRAYLAEAIHLQDSWDSIALRLVQYVRSYYVLSEELMSGQWTTPVDAAIAELTRLPTMPQGFWDGLLDVLVLSKTVTHRLLPRLYGSAKAKQLAREWLAGLGIGIEAAPDEKQFTDAWDKARQKRARQNESWYQTLRSLHGTPLNSVNCEVVERQIERAREGWLPLVDQQYLARATEVLRAGRALYNSPDFEERDRSYHQARSLTEALIADIENNPTRFSLGGLHPLLVHVIQELRRAFVETLANTRPQVTLSLAVKQVTPDKGSARLQFRVANAAGGQPISGVCIKLLSGFAEYEPTPSSWGYQHVIRGGDSGIVQCQVQLPGETTHSQAISIVVQLVYRDRDGNEVALAVQKETLRLYAVDEFQPISPNPFFSWAKGNTVTDRKMFFGREQEIANMADALLVSQARCVLLYGQKRAGKSSVVHHLMERASNSGLVFFVSLSFGDIATTFSEQALFYRMISKLHEAIQKIGASGQPIPMLPVVTLADFKDHPSLVFLDFMGSYRMAIEALPTWQNRRLVFVIDEFTYLYTAIKKNQVPAEIMKVWKAMIERGYFSAVLVGQDVFPRFRDEFPNEFGTTHNVRLSYLPERDATQLLVDPIRIGGTGGESRYQGQALRRALDLISGSAFYGQILASRLVDYMNRERAPNITEADVDNIALQMITGNESLPLADFENLITAGDYSVEFFAIEKVLAILAAVAQESIAGLCSRQALAARNLSDLDPILSDLVKREVLDEPEEGRYRIHIGLFREWLAHRYKDQPRRMLG